MFLLLTLSCVSIASLLAQQVRETEELWIENDGRRIFGILSKPEGGGEKQPIVIVAHGFNGTHHFGMGYFSKLRSLGYQCYSFDFPNGSVSSRSDNNTMNMSVRQEQNDLCAIIDYFKGRQDIDSTRIVLMGESQGGLVAALAAAEKGKDVSGLILIYPALGIGDNWNSRYPAADEIPDTTRIWDVPLGRKFFTELRGMKAFEESARYEGPVIVINGDADNIVRVEQARRTRDIYKNAELHVIPNAGHGFKPAEREQAAAWIAEFLGKNVTK